MIDHRRRLIFIHQRKVAGMSIISALGFAPSNPDWHLFNNGVLSDGWDKRTDDERRYLVVSAVRNPFDRLISSWKYMRMTHTLEEALTNPPREGIEYRHFTRPQVDILRDPVSGGLICDDLIRYETLQQDFDRVCDRLETPRVPLQWVNRSARERGYREYFTSDTRRIAEQMFATDLDAFGYEF